MPFKTVINQSAAHQLSKLISRFSDLKRIWIDQMVKIGVTAIKGTRKSIVKAATIKLISCLFIFFSLIEYIREVLIIGQERSITHFREF